VIALLDAAVAVSYFHDESTSREIRGWLARWIAAGSTFVAPRHFWLELVNALAVGNRYTGEAVLEAVHHLRELPISTLDLDDAGLVLVIDAVERFGLTAYDAEYLALAEQLDVPLATLDRSLAAAAGPRALDPLRLGGQFSEGTAAYEPSTRATWPRYSGAASFLASLRTELERQSARV
jgi:predicted nucleic acid-binding protein